MDTIKQIILADENTVAIYKRTVNGKTEKMYEPIIAWALMQDPKLTNNELEPFDFVVGLNHREGSTMLITVDDDLGDGWEFESYLVINRRGGQYLDNERISQ